MHISVLKLFFFTKWVGSVTLQLHFILFFFMYLTFIFYKLEDGNTVGQNMQEFIVSIN